VFVADHIVQILDQPAEIVAMPVDAERVRQRDPGAAPGLLAQLGGAFKGLSLPLGLS
jgi:hypothetical protein